ncbi:hypothetical protein [Aquimarina macrocephali]|uniref:hypothetical protein n=1 Tax=Aquimarina macrocephali TaxID=666563 RepID=UPI000466E6C3|nr:hypothetical protein [Aquimarina macrocephali]
MEVNEPKTLYLATGKGISEYNKKDYLMPFSLTVGRIAESLIQELFLLEGYQTYKYGLENTYQYLYKQLKYNNTSAAKSLRKSPDLILYDPTNEQLNYAEVKFSSTGHFIFKETQFENYEQSYPEGYFFLVTPTNLYCLPFEEMRKRKKVVFEKCEDLLLINSKHFDLREKSIEHFEKFVSVFYNDEFLKQNSKIHGTYRNY